MNDLGQPWAGRTAFVLGGGPSLTQEECDRLRGECAIVINSTALLAPWAPVLFFQDPDWFRDNRPIIDNWPGQVITSSLRCKRRLPHKLTLIAPPLVPEGVQGQWSSGHYAVDAALALGAKRIVLLGMDCRTVDGRSHCHNAYTGRRLEIVYRETFLPAWAAYPARAAAHGAEIMNATPGSAIECFRQVTIDEVAPAAQEHAA